MATNCSRKSAASRASSIASSKTNLSLSIPAASFELCHVHVSVISRARQPLAHQIAPPTRPELPAVPSTRLTHIASAKNDARSAPRNHGEARWRPCSRRRPGTAPTLAMGLPGAAGPDRALLDPPAHPPAPSRSLPNLWRRRSPASAPSPYARQSWPFATKEPRGRPWVVQRAGCHNRRCRAAVRLLTMARPSQAAGVYEHLDPSEEARKSDLLPAPKESCEMGATPRKPKKSISTNSLHTGGVAG